MLKHVSYLRLLVVKWRYRHRHLQEYLTILHKKYGPVFTITTGWRGPTYVVFHEEEAWTMLNLNNLPMIEAYHPEIYALLI